jgi:hypothetical protein
MSLFFYILNIFLSLWKKETETVSENFFDRLNGLLLDKAITVQYMWHIEDITGATIVLLAPVRELSIIVTRKKLSMPSSVD